MRAIGKVHRGHGAGGFHDERRGEGARDEQRAERVIVVFEIGEELGALFDVVLEVVRFGGGEGWVGADGGGEYEG